MMLRGVWFVRVQHRGLRALAVAGGGEGRHARVPPSPPAASTLSFARALRSRYRFAFGARRSATLSAIVIYRRRRLAQRHCAVCCSRALLATVSVKIIC